MPQPAHIKNPTALKDLLVRDEGRRTFPYTDTTGNLTIGIGHNLTAKGLSTRVQDLLYDDDVEDAILVLNRWLPSWPVLDEVRQLVFISLAFNLGNRLGQFKQLLHYTKHSLWEPAAASLQNSLWFHQVGTRGPRLVTMLKTGLSQ